MPVPTVVNRWLVLALLDPWGGLAYDGEAARLYGRIDLADEGSLRELLKAELAPYFATWTDRARLKTKDSLRYMLRFDRANLEDVFDCVLPPFTAPDAARLFDLLWDELFPGEDPSIVDGERFLVMDNGHEPSGIFRPEEIDDGRRSGLGGERRG